MISIMSSIDYAQVSARYKHEDTILAMVLRVFVEILYLADVLLTLREFRLGDMNLRAKDYFKKAQIVFDLINLLPLYSLAVAFKA